MAITEDFKHARITRFRLERQRKKWIGVSKTRHGQWVKARQEHDPKTAEKFAAWKASVRKLHELTARVNALNQYLANGATGTTLPLAKGVAVWEGGRGSDGLFHPYRDPVGIWTIGYGHTNADGGLFVGPNTKPLTSEEATILLLHDLNATYVPAVLAALRRFRWKVNQRMFDALVSFAYNLGPGYFAPGHTIGDHMARRDARGTANSMLGYAMAGGRILPGLLRRRKWERQLFLGGTYTVTN